ncbi:MAG: heme A synthase [Chloroflexi bacterium]|nr:heme A synthase [Chloroflexota bacterium]
MAVAEYSGPLSQPGKLRNWLRGLASATALLAFALVVLGGVVRVTGSGLGCPDWPLCDGGILPPLNTEALIEFSHRLVASALLGPFVLATCIVVWVAYRRERWLVVPATLAFVMMLVQALLGGITVLNELPGEIVAAHLALGEALLGCLLLVLVVTFRGPLVLSGRTLVDGGSDRLPILALISAVGTFGVIMTGSYVTLSGATTACLGWPLCDGKIFPETGLQMIHMAHRLASAIIAILLAVTLYTGIRHNYGAPQLRTVSIGAAALFLGQVLVGAATVWLKFPVELKALHLALATLVWGAMVALTALSYDRSGLSPEVAHA